MKFLLDISFLLVVLPAARVAAGPASYGLADPTKQPLFATEVPNLLAPEFIYDTDQDYGGLIDVGVGPGMATTGLVDEYGNFVVTPIWGYGVEDAIGYTWPGRTFQVASQSTLQVHWQNRIPIEPGYLIRGKNNGVLGDFSERSVVDTSYHWAYSIHGYKNYTIETHGTPIAPHLHGGHTDAPWDGNPEYFFTPDYAVKGPQWTGEVYTYENSQPASALWYHDHALGITRLNVYTGMVGFYIIRDDKDTGKPNNPLNLPAYPYEIPLVVQDKMFKANGELFYPAFYGDPFYKDFITDEGAVLEHDDDPSALAEFFGDIITVNGKIWPKMNVEPRQYRLRLLNGCDSRFMVIQFFSVPLGATDFANATSTEPIPFTVIGGDQGLATKATTLDTMIWPVAQRFDVIFDFTDYAGERIIMKNLGGDEPFGGDFPGPQGFELTDRIMAFDVSLSVASSVAMAKQSDMDVLAVGSASPTVFDPTVINFANPLADAEVNRVRRVGLFEGHDQFGRLQPLLGTVEPATDRNYDPIYWPTTTAFQLAGVEGQMEGTATWHAPITENPNMNDVEEWEIWNLSADAHPIHLHLVNFMVVKRELIVHDSNADDHGEVEFYEGIQPAGDGTYTADVPLVQHDGSLGEGYQAYSLTKGALLDPIPEYVETFPMDIVTALPGVVTTIRAKFDKSGRYNWHCHILAHEDHEMMRVFHVGPLPGEEVMDQYMFATSTSSSTAVGATHNTSGMAEVENPVAKATNKTSGVPAAAETGTVVASKTETQYPTHRATQEEVQAGAIGDSSTELALPVSKKNAASAARSNGCVVGVVAVSMSWMMSLC